jgi:hypothetical protein
VIAGTATAVSGRVSRRQNAKWANEQEEQQGAQQYAAPEQQYAEAPLEPDYVDEIRRLAAMRDQGLITNDEFEAKKKQILGI